MLPSKAQLEGVTYGYDDRFKWLESYMFIIISQMICVVAFNIFFDFMIKIIL